MAGGRPVIAGGAVRDALTGREAKDLDIEVYALSADQVAAALGGLGSVNAVGKSFGVIKVRTPDGDEVDVALPRRENKRGQGHRGFLVEPDPTMTPREAAARRDFTWNAMMMTPDGELLDFFDGWQDLTDRVIRPPLRHLPRIRCACCARCSSPPASICAWRPRPPRCAVSSCRRPRRSRPNGSGVSGRSSCSRARGRRRDCAP